MSKALLYGIVAAVVSITASATFFFPVISNINSIFKDESTKYTDNKESSENIESTQSSKEKVRRVSNIENPRVDLFVDSSVISDDEKMKVDPLKTEILQGDIPTTKSF